MIDSLTERFDIPSGASNRNVTNPKEFAMALDTGLWFFTTGASVTDCPSAKYAYSWGLVFVRQAQASIGIMLADYTYGAFATCSYITGAWSNWAIPTVTES